MVICKPANLESCVFCAPLDRYIGHHIGRHSIDVLVDILAECGAKCRPTYQSSVGRHIDRHIGRASVDMLTNTQPICWSICRPRVVEQLSADMSIDRLLTFCQYFTATCVLVTVACIADII